MAGYSTLGWTNGAAPAINASNLISMGRAIEIAEHPYGVCSTSAAAAAKTVTIDYSATLSLFTGLRISVKFTYANTVSNPTLNVNSTGAKAIKSFGSTNAVSWLAGQVIGFIYDGTNWMFLGVDAFTKTQSLSSATASAIATQFGTTPSTPDEALSAIVSGCCKIASGTYTGTGTYGPDNKNILSFSFEPQFLIVCEQQYGAGYNAWNRNGFLMWTKGQNVANIAGYQLHFQNYPTTSVGWYFNTSGNATYQMNANGTTYRYVAFGL